MSLTQETTTKFGKKRYNWLANLFLLPGPWTWNQFLREHKFDFLGASGNAEVKEAPLYGKHDNSFNKNHHYFAFSNQFGICILTDYEYRKCGNLGKSSRILACIVYGTHI